MLPLRDRLPTRRVPVVNYTLIALNVLVFVWERMLVGLGVSPDALVRTWGLVPVRLLVTPGDHAINVLSSMFMHDPSGWLHIGSNMLFLWIFGDNVEDAMGRKRYLAFYLLSGLAAAAAQVLIDPYSHVPMVGASGAIAGVLAAYGSLYPRSPITVLNPIPLLWLFFGVFFELPAWVVILEFFLVNAVNGIGSLGGASHGGVAFFAHLGGFVAGLLLVRLFVQRRRSDPERWQGFRATSPPWRRSPTYDHHLRPPPRRDPWGW
jgi:membrane associated rhomboid family serine protease